MRNNRFYGFSQREKKAAAAKQSFSKAQALEASTPDPATNAKTLRKLRASMAPSESRRPTTTTTATTQPTVMTATGLQRKAPTTALCAAQLATRSKKLEDELDAAVDAAIRSLSILEYEYESEEDQLLVCAPEETTVLVAADTGAVDHVIHVSAVPRGCVPDGVVERHFVGANDAHIEAYGGCDTLMTTREGQIAFKY